MSIQPWGWAQNPDLRGLCEIMRELGLDGIDWIGTHGLDPRDIRRMTDDFGIRNVCYTFFDDIGSPDAAVRAKGLAEAERNLDKARILGADKVMIVCAGRERLPRDESRRWCIDSLVRLVPRARAAGLTATTEPFPSIWSPFITSADLLEAVTAVPGFKITFDNGNVMIGDEDPVTAYRNVRDHVVHAHFKDWLPSDTGRASLGGRILRDAMLGEGIVDHAACLKEMVEADYRGYITFECYDSKYAPFDALRRGVRYLRERYEKVRSR